MFNRKIVTTSIRLPQELWLALRKLQEQGKIASIHAACLQGLEIIVKKN
jgi:predicted DNA-binding protein